MILHSFVLYLFIEQIYMGAHDQELKTMSQELKYSKESIKAVRLFVSDLARISSHYFSYYNLIPVFIFKKC